MPGQARVDLVVGRYDFTTEVERLRRSGDEECHPNLLEAWKRGPEEARMMALWALHEVDSPSFMSTRALWGPVRGVGAQERGDRPKGPRRGRKSSITRLKNGLVKLFLAGRVFDRAARDG